LGVEKKVKNYLSVSNLSIEKMRIRTILMKQKTVSIDKIEKINNKLGFILIPTKLLNEPTDNNK
jgi:hypothetical protein